MRTLKGLIVVLATVSVLGSRLFGAACSYWTWDGFYVGLNAGFLRASDRINLTPKGLWGTQPPVIQDFIGGNGSTRVSDWVFTGGAQAGYNFQTCGWLFGLEVDGNYVNQCDTRQTPQIQAPLGITFGFRDHVEQRWLVTVRPRVGYVIQNRFLPYLTGGFATGDVKVTSSITGGTPLFFPYYSEASASKTLKGWTVGAGLEYAFKPSVSVRAEYLHINLGHFTTVSTPAAAFAGFFENRRYSITEDSLRFGLNYRL